MTEPTTSPEPLPDSDPISPQTASSRRRLWLPWLKIGLTLVLLVLLFRQIPPIRVWESIQGASLAWAVLAIVLSFPRRVVEALQVHAFTRHQGLTVSTWKIVEINFITSFYGFFLPGFLATGALGWVRLSAVDRRPAKMFASLVFNRIFETILIALTGLLFWGLDFESHRNWPVFGAFLFLLLGMIGLAGFSASPLLPWSITYAANHRFVPRWLRQKLGILAESASRARSMSLGLHGLLLTLGLGRHLLGVVSMWCFARALALDVSFVNLGWMRSFLNLVQLLPITVNGIGVRDVSLVFVLQDYGVAASAAVALSMLMLARSFVMGLIGGLVELRSR